MNCLVTLCCIEISQKIIGTNKHTIETSYRIHLYKERVIIKNEPIPLTNIFDISYRKDPHPNAIGFLYLHTNKGIKTYYIKDEPSHFVEAFYKLKAKNPL